LGDSVVGKLVVFGAAVSAIVLPVCVCVAATAMTKVVLGSLLAGEGGLDVEGIDSVV
jgi:hypothetical protein